MNRVLTLNRAEFNQCCAELDRQVRSDYSYDLLISIAEGGDHVAALFNGCSQRFSISLQRPDTAAKKRLLTKILPYLPAVICRLMRRIEAWVKTHTDKTRTPRAAVIPPQLLETLKAGDRHILVVDDAVDSGLTLRSVVDSIRQVNVQNEIRTAALAVTRRQTVICPTYSLFPTGDLVRFPWSADILKR